MTFRAKQVVAKYPESKFINDIVNNELQFHYEKPDLYLIKYI